MALARQTPGVESAQAFTKAGIRAPARALARHRPRFQRPAGAAPDRHQAREEDPKPDFSSLRQIPATEQCRARSLDDHALWVSRLSTMANTIIGVGVVPRHPGARRGRARGHLRDPGRDGGEPGGGGCAPLRGRRRRLHRQGIPAPLLQSRPARQRHRARARRSCPYDGSGLRRAVLAGEPGRRPDRGPVRRLQHFGWRGYAVVLLIALSWSRGHRHRLPLDSETIS